MAETHLEVSKVWIDEGCIVCDLCESMVPSVFDVQDETCFIRPEAISPTATQPLTPGIIEAAEDCPVDVIKFDTVEVEGPEPEAWAAAEEEATPGAAGGGGGGGGKKGWTPPAGVPDPIWAKLLDTAQTSGSRSAGGETGIARSAQAPASAVAAALPKNAPPDAILAAMAGSGYAKPVPTTGQNIRDKAEAISRRDAIVFGGGATAALAVGWAMIAAFGATVGGGIQSFMVPKATLEKPSIFRAGKLGDYPEPGVYEKFKDSNNAWIVRDEDGQLFALSTICTHLGCIPNWLNADKKFKCPCHGSGFYQDGVNFEGPAPRPLERLKVTIDGDNLVVDKSVKFRQELGQWGAPDSFIAV